MRPVPGSKCCTPRRVARLPSRRHYYNNFPSILETAGHPGHRVARGTIGLRSAVSLTGSWPVTDVFSPVTALRRNVRAKRVTGAVFLVTGRRPIKKEA
jgi:hypothetical protein